MGSGSSINGPYQATVKSPPIPSPTAVRTLTDVLREYQNGRNTLKKEDVQALENFIKKNSKYVKVHVFILLCFIKECIYTHSFENSYVINIFWHIFFLI